MEITLSKTGSEVAKLGYFVGSWMVEGNIPPGPVKQRYTMKILSASRYEVKFQICEDGKIWLTFMMGIAQRV